jgi:hypothetical protein
LDEERERFDKADWKFADDPATSQALDLIARDLRKPVARQALKSSSVRQ